VNLNQVIENLKVFTSENLAEILIIFGIILIFFVAIIVDRRKKTNISRLKKIALSALLISLHIVITRYLSIQTQFLRVSFEVTPLLLAGMILGPKYAVLIGGISDLLGATIFATSGAPYFPGFTLNAVLIGCICGIFLYEPKNLKRSNLKFLLLLIGAEAVIFGIITMVLTPIWLSIMYDKAAAFIVAARIISKAIVIAVEIPLVIGIRLAIKPLLEKHIYEEEEI